MAEATQSYNVNRLIISEQAPNIFLLDNIFSSDIFGLLINLLCMFIGVLGIWANILNVIVFLKQGLDNSINISFFCKSVSDLFKILFIEWANVSFNTYVDRLPMSIVFSEVYFVAGSWPSGLVCRLSLYIAVYITAERCLCILYPLKVKTLITPTRTKVSIAVIGIFNFAPLVPEYTSVYLSWTYHEERNATVLGLALRSSSTQTQGVSFLFHVAMVMFGLACVIVFTSILVVQLRRQSRWRMMNSGGNLDKTSPLSKRDRRSVAMVIVVAVALVIFYTPLASMSIITTFVAEFYISGKYTKPFLVLWNLVYIFGMVNCSLNIIIYYKMNSRFKSTLVRLFRCSVKDTKTTPSSSSKATSVSIVD
ncbi:tachykinin-like peptides receptor 86C [Biomphalaria pfeifferi]|uniref:Tachykinin-like peptides receptor 86C n=1 Tax=Biomphalaria pfeifferi TaxID=112525 RepID=A0AAD8EZ04_BIOPF|nr:tachykinin-like peptides receptor 86C [Biomphalaria pfeifferi]